MTKTITRLFDSHTEALSALGELERAGIDQDRISLVSNNTDNWHGSHQHETRRGGPLGDRDGDGDNDVAEGAGKGATTGGATTGGLIGGAGGLLAGLGMLAIPGLGPVVAAGWLVSTAVGAAVGAAAGGATGGLLGALKEAGHSDEEAGVYSEGVRRGGTLVSVKAHEDEIAQITQIFDGRSGVEASVRGVAYREKGWSGFDPAAQPYTSEQISSERRQYAEGRSFARETDGYADDDLNERRRTGDAGISRAIPGAPD
jgi:hypothetical protein